MISYNIKIKSFEIKNFRLFDHQKFDFSNMGNFYSFVGRNGTGKTAVLEALNICISENSSKFNTIQEDDFYSDDPIEFTVEFTDFFFFVYPDGVYQRLLPCKKFTKKIKKRDRKETNQFFSPTYDISIEYNFFTFTRDSLSVHQNRWRKYTDILHLDNIFVVFSLEFIPEHSKYLFTIASNPDTKFEIPLWQMARLEKVLYPNIFYFDKGRDRELILEKYNTTFSNIVDELDWRYKKASIRADAQKDIIQSYDGLHEHIIEVGVRKQNETITHKPNSFKQYKEELLRHAKDVLDQQLKVDFDINALDFYFFNYDRPFSKAIFGHRSAQDRIISIQRSGSGIEVMVILSFLLAFAEQSKMPIIILIDEPELHLHADLQKNLYNLLHGKSFQVFVSTHSHLFINRFEFENNWTFQRNAENKIDIKQGDQITVATTLFELFGNRLEDLYIPENLLLVSGKYDRIILSKCLRLLDNSNKSLLILSCGGDTEIPTKAEAIDKFFEQYINKDRWYSRFIEQSFRIIVDGDVSNEKIASWEARYSLSKSQYNHLSVDCMEYLYPESLVKNCVAGQILKDGTQFKTLTKDAIVAIILGDEKLRNNSDKQKEMKQGEDQPVSKQRLTEFVANNMTIDILNKESSELAKLVRWILQGAEN